jgi:hypothetical protein
MLYSRNFPVGEQFFEKLRLDEAIYIDKTRFILPLQKKSHHTIYRVDYPNKEVELSFSRMLLERACQSTNGAHGDYGFRY